MTKAMQLINFIRLFLVLVREDDKKYEPEKYLHTLPKNGLGGIKIHGRGGLEVSSSEIKNSPEFIAMESYAKERTKKDLDFLKLLEEYDKHLRTEGEIEQK